MSLPWLRDTMLATGQSPAAVSSSSPQHTSPHLTSPSYRIHLSPGSRRSSTRSAVSRAMNSSAGPKRSSAPSSAVEPPMSPPPLSAPPALEPARPYNHHSPGPDSPPPLAQATLPATAHLPSTSSSRSSSSPELTYSSGSHNLIPISSQGPSQGSQSYSYRGNTSTYQDQSHGAGYTYVHTTPLTHHSSGSNSNSFSSYPNSHANYGAHSLPHINTSSPVLHPQHPHDSPNPTPISSRHSISHISHPQSYPQNHSSSTEPASPASSHSHHSGPTTPSYVYHDDGHGYHHSNGIVNDQSSLSNGHLPHHQTSYHPSSVSVHSHHRFDSPPPTLAPIQEHRYNRRDDRHTDSHSSGSYLHHNTHSMSNDFHYHPSMALGHNTWKSESGIRKGVGALV